MKALFDVQCLHDYFANGVCRALRLVPTSNCARLLARYRLVFRALPGGGAVYYNEDASPLAQFTESAPLAFWLINDDPALLSYTDCAESASDASRLFYFDNLHCKPRTSSTLASGTLAAPRLPACPARFELPIDPTQRAVKLELLGQLQGSKDPVWQALSPDAPLATLQLDFGSQGESRYQLTKGGVKALDFWLGQPPARAWGVVAIYPGGPRQAANVPRAARALSQESRVSAKTYSIELTARRLRWRYHLIGQTEMNLSHYQVLANHKVAGKLHFDGAPGEPLGGQPSYRFTARELLPLAERPGDAISVQLTPLPHARPQLTVNLAYPRAENVSGIENGQHYADVFVYL